MITLKITNKRQDKTNVIYWYNVLKDGTPTEEALQIVRTPEMSKDDVINQLKAIKAKYVAAETLADKTPDTLIGMEI